MAGFKKGTKEIFFNDLKDAVREDLNQHADNEKLTAKARRDVEYLQAVDTRRLKKGTKGTLEEFSKSFLITLETQENVTNKSGDFYPYFVYFGEGTNWAYGPRPYLEVTASRLIKTLALDKNTFAGISGSTFIE